MLVYLLKFSACLAIFMVFYKLFLERENMHHIKRYYLLAALLVSIVIPLVTFIQYVEPTIAESFVQPTVHFISSAEIENVPTKPDYTPLVLWSIYSLGVLLFGLKFSFNLLLIFKKITTNPKFKNAHFVNVLLTDLIRPHTFFNYIFFNKNQYEAQEIPLEVFIHEQTHAKQKHSIDVLFIELLQVVFWFNPLLYIIKKDIKLNHEFLADDAVLKQGIEPSKYQQILLTFSSNVTEPQLANAINYSSIKKRFTVMKTHTSKQKIWLKSVLLLPLVALTLYGFSTKETIEKEQTTTEEYQQKATSEEVAEYNNLAKQYNSQSDDNRVIKLKDMKRLKELYDKMTKDQKSNAEPFPNFPPPPPPASTKESPQVVQMHDLPPPPPIPANATFEQKQKYQKAIDNYHSQKEGYTYKHQTKDGKMVDVVVIPELDEMVPPPPPPPPATTSQTKSQSQVRTGFVKGNVENLYYVEIENKKTYYNRQGNVVDKNGKKLNGDAQVNASDVIPGQYITKVYNEDKVEAEFKNNKPELASTNLIAPPPPPKSPLEHVIEMAKKDAVFYFENKQISSDEAIQLLKNNNELNISTKQMNSTEPQVYIQKEPINITE